MSQPDLQLGRGQTAPVQQRSHDRPASLDNPRAPRRRAGMPNFEKYAWLFMRFSGVALVFLALGHLFIMLMWDNGVYRIDFNYVAQRWALAVLADLGPGCCCGWPSCTAATACAPSSTTTAARTPPGSG